MGVSAVPGSGKTWTLSRLAAKLVMEGGLKRRQQVLVVTLVNSARGKFEQQVRQFLGERSLGTKYRVRTLHGLANDIVSERPALAGLSDDFQIIPESASTAIIDEAVVAWLDANKSSPIYDYLIESERKKDSSRNKFRLSLSSAASEFIRLAKDYQKTPDALRRSLTALGAQMPMAELYVSVYDAYERGLKYRGAVDFDDLIRLALQAIDSDQEFLERLRYRWPYVLEDEAQDSSRLQEQILRKLSGEHGNWVRVGDPNQAIYETFTTASPRFLINFLNEASVARRELPDSGRSSQSIIRLANHLIDWSITHPNVHVRSKHPLAKPHIRPLETGNPEDRPDSIEIDLDDVTPDEERRRVAESVQEWLAENRDKTVSILVPRNDSGADLVKVLRGYGVEYEEALKNTTSTRQVAGSLYRIVKWLSRPGDDDALAKAFEASVRADRDDEIVKSTIRKLHSVNFVERFMAPRDRDWLIETFGATGGGEERRRLEEFREKAQKWQAGVVLPVEELVLTIAGDIFTQPAELATAYAIALSLRDKIDPRKGSSLSDIAIELEQIARNTRRVVGLSEADDNFDPESYRGRVVVTTTHKAKGLEWDRVYLMSVNNYDFPSADPNDTYQGEPYYVRDNLNLQAEALGILETLATGFPYTEGEATRDARLEYASERLRLLYVGITRARRELRISTNIGKSKSSPKHAARPVSELRRYLDAEIGRKT